MIDLARIIQQTIGPANFAHSYGGDNFPLIFANCSLVEGVKLAEAIRKNVEEYECTGGFHMTVRLGVD